jgi:hypothetical protein
MIRLPLAAAFAALVTTVASAEGCASDAWATFLSPGPQVPMPSKILETSDGREVLRYDMGDLAGEQAKRYVFVLRGDLAEQCLTKAVVLGSYAALADETATPDKRGHALYLYDGGAHATLKLFTGEPPLDEITPRALQAFD